MTGLVFIRHAETDMGGTFCGHSNPPINSQGREQISGLVASLASETFDEIHSSDLLRAASTALSLSAAFAIPLSQSDDLREIHFGDWEGRTWAEIEQKDPAYAQRWMQDFPALPAPNGESFGAFQTRVLLAVDRLLLLAQTKRIAAVTHGGVMRIVLCSHLGYTEQQAWDSTKLYCSSFVCPPLLALKEVPR